MKSIPVQSLKPNSYFEKPVYIDKGYIVLSPETPVTVELIRRLNDWNYSNLYSESDKITMTSPGLKQPVQSEIGTLDKSITESKIEKKVNEFYTSLLLNFNDICTRYYETGEIDLQVLTEKIKEIITMLRNYKNNLITTMLHKRNHGNYLISHCINTTIITLSIAEILKFTPHRLIDIGVAAMLHEIGMLKLPPRLYLNNQVLSPQERKTMTAHTVLGYKILKTMALPDAIALCAIEHHERADGSGYPRGIKNDSISLYSRIIAIACSFDGMVSKRPYKKSLDGHKAMIDLLVTQKNNFDENLLKAFIYSLSLFPPGTYVQLSNNARGVVSRINPQQPKFPTVKIIFNEYGEKLPAEVELQTSEKSGISIRHVLSEAEIDKMGIDE